MPVHFFVEDCNFILQQKAKIKKWIKRCITDHSMVMGDVTIIFTSDNYLREINKSYLNRDYLTDIITFNYNENQTVSGDLFISVERTKENAEKFNTKENDELLRVIIHGVIHLIGYDDADEKGKEEMRSIEDKYLGEYEQEYRADK